METYSIYKEIRGNGSFLLVREGSEQQDWCQGLPEAYHPVEERLTSEDIGEMRVKGLEIKIEEF